MNTIAIRLFLADMLNLNNGNHSQFSTHLVSFNQNIESINLYLHNRFDINPIILAMLVLGQVDFS